MATAVDKWPAYARLSAVAPASHLPTAPTPPLGTRPVFADETVCRRSTPPPVCQSSCRADRIGTFGGADSKQWLGTDRHTRTG